MKITVIGTGYVGLVTGLGFAEVGHSVLCYDNNTNKIKTLLKGVVPIYEAQAQELLDKHLGKKIGFTNDVKKAASYSDLIFLCVGLKNGVHGHPEIHELKTLIAQLINSSAVEKEKTLTLVIKSTVPVGTHEDLENFIANKWKTRRILVVTNPEFLSEGEAVNHFMNPFRIIIGTESTESVKILKRVYASFKNTPFVSMSSASAEMTKHAANAMLATKISFINEISRFCEATSADIEAVKKGIGLDPRIGPHFINPGPGFGGSCLPKDVTALIHLGRRFKERAPLLQAVHQTNQMQTAAMVDKIKKLIKKHSVENLTVWGVSYKPGTDDIRCSPSLEILQALTQEPIKIKVHDPQALSSLKQLPITKKLELVHSLEKSIEKTDMIVLLTEWVDYKKFNFRKYKSSMTKNILLDARNLYSSKDLKAYGFTYYSIGRPE